MQCRSQNLTDRQTDRQYYIDFLKVIGLTGIIIAHVGSPSWAMMLRSFDVPLMVIISSLLAEKSYKKYGDKGLLSARQYFVSRIKRLVIPTWIFLTFYFVIFALFSGRFQSVEYYIASYCLTRYGIGYVWVILIYLYSAMLIPLFNKLNFSYKSAILVLAVYLIYEIAYYFQIGTTNKILDTTLYYIIPYGLLTYLGYNYNNIHKKARYWVVLCSGLIFASFGGYYWFINGSPQLVQIAKYPPRFYYLSYGVMWSFSLLLICGKYNLKIYTNPLIRYISTHSMWIYLWHILALSAYSAFRLPETWFLKLIIVYALALIAVYVNNFVLDLFEKKKKVSALKYLRG